ncbi:MAG: carbon monoxide dehydrogenase [Pelagibacterales bacterium]|nr:carbon monoxide dehydrogenase [Pelagibacterales bacterium]|tara:strand:+ start:3616 stop:4101 length:486 start_codon:yes stop_codon:yes gene_type:complete
MAKLTINITVNDKKYEKTINPNLLLVDFIREELKLTGTHVGCDTSQCGACMVMLNGRAVKSCSILLAQLNNQEIKTIENLEKNDELHPMQEAFRNNHGLQCGFCTPGMIISAISLVNENDSPDEDEIRKHIEGNFCRCTGYQNIIKSISEGAKNMKDLENN